MIYNAWKNSRTIIEQLALPDNLFADIDFHFASAACAVDDCRDPGVFLLLLMLSFASRNGSVCIDRRHADILHDFSPYPEFEQRLNTVLGDGGAAEKIAKLGCVGKPGEYKPVILDGERMYLQRYHTYETIIAKELTARSGMSANIPLLDADKDALMSLFPEENSMQRLAAWMALRSPLTVVTGGPGTGKTTTVVKILLLLLDKYASAGKNIRIALGAPTGKAAMHLASSISGAIERFRNEDAALFKKYEKITAMIPDNGLTLHRLLGFVPGSPFFKHDYSNKVPYDLVVVDEASMIDTALMAKLLAALDRETKIIILGDKDQLASVQSGAVMADICDNGDIPPYSSSLAKEAEKIGVTIRDFSPGKIGPVQESIVYFTRSHRFSDESGIGKLSALVRGGNTVDALKEIERGRYADIVFIDAEGDRIFDVVHSIIDEHLSSGRYFADADDCADIFKRQKNLQLLTPLRRGLTGVENINRTIEKHLAQKGIISTRNRFYNRMPILINENDYTLSLFNGETGILLEEEDTVYALFPDQSKEGAFRRFNPRQIRSFEKSYAITVHKSQGSEYDEVVLILPESDNPLNSREMIYTALTRAKTKVTIVGKKSVFGQGISRKTERSTGLNGKLWFIS